VTPGAAPPRYILSAVRTAVALLASLALAWLAVAGCGDRRESAAARGLDREPPPARGMSPEAYDRWRRPERIIAALDLAPGQAVADVGAGTGYLTLRLADAVGPRGRVTATDIDEHALAELGERARGARPGAAPIEARRVAPDDPGLETGAYDRILLAQVDHLLPDRVTYLRRLRAALAPGGRIAVSNRLQHRDGLLRAAASAGYTVARDAADLPGQFLVLLLPEPEAHRP
jgi:predicted methyltransferase